MKIITKERLEEFKKKYHEFHDGNIIDFIEKDNHIELTVDMYDWCKIKMVFEKITEYKYNENLLFYFQNKSEEISYMNIKSSEDNIGIVFYEMYGNPILYIVAKDIFYEFIEK